MIPHLNGRAAALEPLGWTGRDAEWLALVCLHSGVFLRAEYLAFLGGVHRSAAARFVERYGAWCGRKAGRRAPVERAWRGTAAVQGSAAVTVPGAGGRARAAPARGVAGGSAETAPVARLRGWPSGRAVAGDRGGEGLGAGGGGRARARAAAQGVPGPPGLTHPLFRAQAAARPGRRAGDVRVRPSGRRDAERRPQLG